MTKVPLRMKMNVHNFFLSFLYSLDVFSFSFFLMNVGVYFIRVV